MNAYIRVLLVSTAKEIEAVNAAGTLCPRLWPATCHKSPDALSAGTGRHSKTETRFQAASGLITSRTMGGDSASQSGRFDECQWT